ncbi:MAG: pilin N-terminal domain-containing protein [Enterococcus sp.]|nr:pilin N-terminal domain-containing protein [Enterococcus sp.]
MKRIVRWLLILGILPLLNSATSTVRATEAHQVHFVIHKIVFPNGRLPADSENTGEETDAHASLLKEYRGLNGVIFDVYDQTNAVYELRATGVSAEDAQRTLADEGPRGQSIAETTTKTIAGQAGSAEFSLNTKSNGRDAVYLFYERGDSENSQTKSRNLVAVLPIFDNGKVLNTIHLYPKSEEKVHQTPDFTKTILDGKGSYDYGEAISYQDSVKLPADMLDYKTFKIVDQADAALSLNQASFKITIDGQDVSHLFTIKLGEHGYELSIKNIADFEKYSMKTLTIAYSMAINSRKKIDQAFLNTAKLITDHETITKQVMVKTGGKKFRKVDLKEFSKGLSKAEFNVLNEQKQYLKETANGYRWTSSASDSEIVKVISDKNGAFQIAGLSYGTYRLKEIKAPDGYEKGDELIPFTVTSKSFSTNEDVLRVVNKRIESPPPKKGLINTILGKLHHPTNGNAQTTKKKAISKTQPSGILRFPQTNDQFNMVLIWFGGLIILWMLLILWRRRKREEKQDEEIEK